MAGTNEQQARETFSRQNLIFYLFMIIFALLGIAVISGSILLRHDAEDKLLIFGLGQSIPDNYDINPANSGIKTISDRVTEFIRASNIHDPLGADLLRDLGIAILTSVFVTLGIEQYASKRLREHIAYNVLSAAYAKVVPEDIYTQIRDNVFRSDVYRRNWEVHIHSNVQHSKAGETAIITVSYSYDIENLNDHRILFPTVASIDLDDPPPTGNLPKFTLFEITSERNRELVKKEDRDYLINLLKTGPGNIGRVPRGNLLLQKIGQELILTATVPIAARRRVTVRYDVEREIRVPGNYVLSAAVPADGIRIIIRVIGFKMAVVALHPNRGALYNAPGRHLAI